MFFINRVGSPDVCFFQLFRLHSCKLTYSHGKSTILMLFTSMRKDRDFPAGYVNLPDGNPTFLCLFNVDRWWLLAKVSPATPRDTLYVFGTSKGRVLRQRLGSWRKIHKMPSISGLLTSLVALWSPKWGSLNPWKGHSRHPKRALGRTMELIYNKRFNPKKRPDINKSSTKENQIDSEHRP